MPNVLYTAISDHSAVEFKFQLRKCSTGNVSYARFYDEMNTRNFVQKLKYFDWTDIYSLNEINADEQCNLFMGKFLTLFYEAFPLRPVVPKIFRRQGLVASDPEVSECKLSALQVILSYHPELKEVYNKNKKRIQ